MIAAHGFQPVSNAQVKPTNPHPIIPVSISGAVNMVIFVRRPLPLLTTKAKAIRTKRYLQFVTFIKHQSPSSRVCVLWGKSQKLSSD